MELIVDGIVYFYQKYGGISRFYTETLPLMCNLKPDLNITLLTHPNVSMESLPVHEHIFFRSIPDVYRYIRPHRFWHKYYSQLCQLAARPFLGRSKGKIWLSTYYTSPIAWVGPQIVFAHDFILEKYRTRYWQNELSYADETIRMKATAIAKADLVICISETTRQDLLKLYQIPFHKTAVVHLAYKSSFTLIYGMRDQQMGKYILFVGNRGYYKDFDLLLRSYANWPGRFKINLVCVGGRGMDGSGKAGIVSIWVGQPGHLVS